jgi:hypothetical protein
MTIHLIMLEKVMGPEQALYLILLWGSANVVNNNNNNIR